MSEIIHGKQIQKLTPDLAQDLVAAYREYSGEKGFPYGSCKRVHREIAEDHGLQYEEGYFMVDTPKGKGKLQQEHAWCTDADGKIIDLTADQFNPNLNIPLPRGLNIISLNNPLYKRYFPV